MSKKELTMFLTDAVFFTVNLVNVGQELHLSSLVSSVPTVVQKDFLICPQGHLHTLPKRLSRKRLRDENMFLFFWERKCFYSLGKSCRRTLWVCRQKSWWVQRICQHLFCQLLERVQDHLNAIDAIASSSHGFFMTATQAWESRQYKVKVF